MSNKQNKVVGYLRVSTQDQDLEKFKSEILRLANDKGLPGPVEWVEEKVSGNMEWRKRKLGDLLNSLSDGDTVIVPELSRLGRSTLQILEIMRLAKENGIAVHSVKGGWSLTSSMESKIVLNVLAMVAEIERDLISIRTKEALRARKEAGVKLGRPKGPGKSKLDAYREEIVALLRNGSTKVYVARKYDTTAANLHNWLSKREIDSRPFQGGESVSDSILGVENSI